MRLASVTKFGLMIASRVSTPWADTVIGTRVATKATIALASNARDQSDLRVMLVLLAILLVCQCPRRSGPARDGCRERRPAVCGPAVGAAYIPPFSIAIAPGAARLCSVDSAAGEPPDAPRQVPDDRPPVRSPRRRSVGGGAERASSERVRVHLEALATR